MDRKYQMETAENKAFMREMRDALLNFGKQFPSPGGSAYYLGDKGEPWKEKNRETYCTARMAHVYSIGTLIGDPDSPALVDAALKGLCGELRDAKNGGWYSGLDPQGKNLEGKLCYTHAFVILAAASAVLAGREGAQELLKEALDVYDLWFWKEEEGLACDSYNTDFTVCGSYRGLNANMHSVEAFLAAADVTGKEEYRERAGRIIDHVIGWASQNNWRIPEHFTADWKVELEYNKDHPTDPFKPYGATPGHAMEWSRLILQWSASEFGNAEQAKPYIQAAEHLFCQAVADSWNADGAPGIVYTTDWNGKPVVHDRMHWTLAEAINTAAVLWRATGKKEYADRYAEFLQYLDETVWDSSVGSWFEQLDRSNRLLGTVWPGKPDLYHAFQAVMIPYCAYDTSIAAAVKRNQYTGK